jgi:hypothetical protein
LLNDVHQIVGYHLTRCSDICSTVRVCYLSLPLGRDTEPEIAGILDLGFSKTHLKDLAFWIDAFQKSGMN